MLFDKKRFFKLTLFTFLFNVSSILPESIRLTSGQILEGKILEESEKVIVIQTSKGTFPIKKIDILEMERPDSKETIAKPPEDKKPGKLSIGLMSFIPGYSPLYHSKERAELGVPMAMLTFNYFYHLLQFQFNTKHASFLNSIEMKNPLLAYYNFGVLPVNVGNSLGSQSRNLADNGLGIYVYFNVRTALYQRNSDRVVEGRLMSEDEYLKEKRRYLESFVAASILNGVVSYLLLSSEGSVGALYKTESKGIKTVFYAFPSFDGGIFGVASRF
jgi:hypothetical protein